MSGGWTRRERENWRKRRSRCERGGDEERKGEREGREEGEERRATVGVKERGEEANVGSTGALSVPWGVAHST